MEPTSLTRRQVREVLDLATDPDISAAQLEDDMAAGVASPDGYTEAEVDRIIADVDRELAADACTETKRLSRDFLDERPARRARRRADRAVLRSLPARLDVAELAAEEFGEAA